MTLEEMQSRLKKEKATTQEDVWHVNALYLLLDLPKDEFCKIIDSVGFEKLKVKKDYYEKTLVAQEELRRKERYQKEKEKLINLKYEIEYLEKSIIEYEKNIV